MAVKYDLRSRSWGLLVLRDALHVLWLCYASTSDGIFYKSHSKSRLSHPHSNNSTQIMAQGARRRVVIRRPRQQIILDGSQRTSAGRKTFVPQLQHAATERLKSRESDVSLLGVLSYLKMDPEFVESQQRSSSSILLSFDESICS